MASLLTSKKIDAWSFPAVPVAICSYEVLALASNGRLKTLTRLMHDHPWTKFLFVGSLALHLLNEKE